MKSIISHFYNEEYLLPWWLEHHKKFFDYGLMINYNSTDRSVDIIKEICPDWQIVDSVNKDFDAEEVDKEVMYYEEQIPGWKICLNTPEFLYGNFKSLEDNSKNTFKLAPAFYFVDKEDNSSPDLSRPLHEQYVWGCSYKDRNSDLSSCFERGMRLFHTFDRYEYRVGRHFHAYESASDDFVIFYYGLAPMNENLIKRKLQIKNRIPESDVKKSYGGQHMITDKELFEILNQKFRPISKDLSEEVEKFVNLCY